MNQPPNPPPNPREMRKLTQLKLWDKNPRGIKTEDYHRLKRQIQKLGQYKPLIITDDGMVLGGNMRLRAYQELGINEVWVSVVDAPTDKQKLEYALSDNDRAGYYEGDKLAELIMSVPDIDLGDYKVDLGKLTNIEDLLAQFGPEVVEDEAPPVPEKAESKLGEVYQLGRHRLMCGDATKIEDVEKLMDGQKAEIMFTSPPYIDMRTYEGDKDLDINHLKSFIPTWSLFSEYEVVNLGLKFKDGEVVAYWQDYINEAQNNGLKLLAWNVWDKTQGGSIASATNMFLLTHEWIFVFGKEAKKLNRTIPNQIDKYEARHGKDWEKGISDKRIRKQDGSITTTSSSTYTNHQLHSVIQQVPELGNIRSEHPAIFPIKLPVEYIKAMTDKNDIVADCFGGSGSTLIACEQTNRTCYMMELDPKYCDVIRQRYANFIGRGKG